MSNDFIHIVHIKEDCVCAKCKDKLLLTNSFGVIFDGDIICLHCAFSIAANTIEELNKFLIELSPYLEEIKNVKKSTGS